VIGLQEVVFASPRGGGQLDVLARATGLHGVAAPLFAFGDDLRGNALLTRLPVLYRRHHDVSWPGREPRGVLDVDLDGPRGRVRALVVHFGLRSAERARQARTLMSILSDPTREPAVTAVMGDFNEWRPWTRTQRRLARAFGATTAPRTFPARLPVLRLDRIWTMPPSPDRVRAHDTPRARAASDHLPVACELAMPTSR
jgi:endonuclease/exonuclease/phosphatase family metal-dependent hydrolase